MESTGDSQVNSFEYPGRAVRADSWYDRGIETVPGSPQHHEQPEGTCRQLQSHGAQTSHPGPQHHHHY